MSAKDPVLPVRTRRVVFLGSFPQRPPPSRLPEVAFYGRSNVGKSSALNALTGNRKAARVSKTPGRTQALNLFEVDDRVTFVDLPGYGYAEVPEAVQESWRAAIERYLVEREQLRLVVLLVDARHEAQRLDIALLRSLREAGRPVLVVATKIDKLNRSQRARHLAALARGLEVDRQALLPFSSETNLGVAEVWSRLEAAIRPQ